MKDKSLLIIGILLVAAIGNYTRFIDSGNTRPVEFIFILAIGMLAGLLIGRLFLSRK